MRIGIIGAGVSGLNSAHYAIKNNFECTIFEQTGDIGGIWVYRDEIDYDQFGMPIHTSMYYGLRTNFPYQLMSFSNYPMKDRTDLSYLPQEDILEYLQDYADHFQLRKYIKFYNHIKLVKPLENGRWQIISMDVRTKDETKYEFDAIMVCVGHNSVPNYAKLKGIENFSGTQLHSHSYRKPEQFENQNILLVGAGYSGIDLTFKIGPKSKKLFLSHHLPEKLRTTFPGPVVQKPDVEKVTSNTVIFKDGTEEHVDTIIYCTGYKYSFPFLSKDCGIFVEDNYVQPLYKHLININHPTMAIIGLPFIGCIFLLVELQAQFFMKFLKNQIEIPSKADMMKEKENDEKRRHEAGLKKCLYHSLGIYQEEYLNDLAKWAQIEPVKPVLMKIYADCKYRIKTSLKHFRSDIYKVIDDNNFEVEHGETEIFG